MAKIFHAIVHFLWMAFNLIWVFALLLADLAMWISPTSSRLMVLAGIAFLALFFVNIFFAATWLFSSHKSWCLVSVLAMLVSLPALQSTYSHHRIDEAEQATSTHTLHLLTYNTHLTQMVKKAKDNDVLRYVKQSDADIVLLQEYEVRKQATWLTFEEARAYLRDEYPYSDFQFAVETGRRRYGTAIFSKYPLRNAARIPYTSAANSSSRCDVIVDTDTFRLINNHLESNAFTEKDLSFDATGVDDMDDWMRTKSEGLLAKLTTAAAHRSEQARAVRDEVDASPYPVILCGDFNDVPVSYTYHTIRFGGKSGPRAKEDLTDAFLMTSCGKRGSTFVKHGLGIRIDYILTSPFFTPVHTQIDRLDYSDHYPLSATISW